MAGAGDQGHPAVEPASRALDLELPSAPLVALAPPHRPLPAVLCCAVLCCAAACSYTARVELSSKVLDCFGKLERTLCHELCHVAAWLVDHIAMPPHGTVF